MCVCVCVCLTHVHTHTHTRTHTHTHTHTHTNKLTVHTFVRMYICLYIIPHIHMYIRTYVHTYICTYVPPILNIYRERSMILGSKLLLGTFGVSSRGTLILFRFLCYWTLWTYQSMKVVAVPVCMYVYTYVRTYLVIHILNSLCSG